MILGVAAVSQQPKALWACAASGKPVEQATKTGNIVRRQTEQRIASPNVTCRKGRNPSPRAHTAQGDCSQMGLLQARRPLSSVTVTRR
jgi:hypothetical protein